MPPLSRAVVLILWCGSLLLSRCEALSPRRIGGWKQAEAPTAAGRPSTANCTWSMFQQKVDHFGADSVATFPQRVCTYSKWWRGASSSGFKVRSKVFFTTF